MDALLEAILANPDDDDVRLVYADALEAAGDPRGELIQLQCRLARAHDPLLVEREQELLKEHGRELLADLTALKVNAVFTFERGFVARMAAHFPAVTQRTAEIIALAPLLEHLQLSIYGQLDRVQLARPKETALLARARSLTIKGRHTGTTRGGRGPIADFSGLTAIPLARLRSLGLQAVRAKPQNLVAFLQSLTMLEDVVLHLLLPSMESRLVLPAIGPVRSLDFRNNTFDGVGLRGFLDGDRSTLEYLQLALPDVYLTMLQDAPLPALRVLALPYAGLSERQLDPASWKNAPKLEKIIV